VGVEEGASEATSVTATAALSEAVLAAPVVLVVEELADLLVATVVEEARLASRVDAAPTRTAGSRALPAVEVPVATPHSTCRPRLSPLWEPIEKERKRSDPRRPE